jgi:hypothetical protein
MTFFSATSVASRRNLAFKVSRSIDRPQASVPNPKFSILQRPPWGTQQSEVIVIVIGAGFTGLSISLALRDAGEIA